MAKSSNKDDGSKRISGINRFLYRGYEVYDSVGNRVDEPEVDFPGQGDTGQHEVRLGLPKERGAKEISTEPYNVDISNNSVCMAKVEFPEDIVTGRQSTDGHDVDSAKGFIQSTDTQSDKRAGKAEPKYRKRPVRDQQVWENLRNISDPVLRGGLSGTMFGGTVNQQLAEIKLSDTKKEITPRPIISEIISMQQHIKFKEGCSPYLRYIDDGVEKTVSVHQNMVTFLKSAIVSQYNASMEFSQVVSAFICELVLQIISRSYTLPIAVQADSKLQEVILKELNDYCKELFENCNIKYGEVVTEQPIKKNKKKAESIIDQLVESAGVAKV